MVLVGWASSNHHEHHHACITSDPGPLNTNSNHDDPTKKKTKTTIKVNPFVCFVLRIGARPILPTSKRSGRARPILDLGAGNHAEGVCCHPDAWIYYYKERPPSMVPARHIGSRQQEWRWPVFDRPRFVDSDTRALLRPPFGAQSAALDPFQGRLHCSHTARSVGQRATNHRARAAATWDPGADVGTDGDIGARQAIQGSGGASPIEWRGPLVACVIWPPGVRTRLGPRPTPHLPPNRA